MLKQSFWIIDDAFGSNAKQLLGAFADIGVTDVAIRGDETLIDNTGNGF